jgi:hypothetical protein
LQLLLATYGNGPSSYSRAFPFDEALNSLCFTLNHETEKCKLKTHNQKIGFASSQLRNCLWLNKILYRWLRASRFVQNLSFSHIFFFLELVSGQGRGCAAESPTAGHDGGGGTSNKS